MPAPRGRPPDKERLERALELRLKGLSYAEIGEALGVSRQRAQQMTCPPRAISWAVAMRAKWRCEGCRVKTRRGHIHHRQAVGKIADTYQDLGNLQYLCVGCHRNAHGRDFNGHFTST